MSRILTALFVETGPEEMQLQSGQAPHGSFLVEGLVLNACWQN